MSYKILSLDGGGSWALIQAKVLLDLYGDIHGHELLKQFDLAIANSGGSLVLACLCNDMKLSEIAEVFQDESSRRKVFNELSFWGQLIRKIIGIGPKYSAKKKLEGLIEVLSKKDRHYSRLGKYIVNTPMNELPAIIGKPNLQLLIVGFDYYRERVSFFRSNMQSKTDLFSNKYYGMPLGHAIHCSSNAPVNYFDTPAEVNPFIFQKKPDFKEPVYRNTTWFWDGAVSGFNNPVLAGLVEATTNGADARNCCILSIGTGTGNKVILTDVATSNDPADIAKVKANKDNEFVIIESSFAFKMDVKKMATSILDDPPDSATFIAYSFMDPALTGEANLVRINPCYSPEYNKSNNRFEIPNVYKADPDGLNKARRVFDLDMDAVENAEVDVILDLCEKFITEKELCLPNQLIRGDINGKFLGYPTYREAKAKWRTCQ